MDSLEMPKKRLVDEVLVIRIVSAETPSGPVDASKIFVTEVEEGSIRLKDDAFDLEGPHTLFVQGNEAVVVGGHGWTIVDPNNPPRHIEILSTVIEFPPDLYHCIVVGFLRHIRAVFTKEHKGKPSISLGDNLTLNQLGTMIEVPEILRHGGCSSVYFLHRFLEGEIDGKVDMEFSD